jgi:hypothetical protein
MNSEKAGSERRYEKRNSDRSQLDQVWNPDATCMGPGNAWDIGHLLGTATLKGTDLR